MQITPDGETDHSHLSLNREQIATGYTMQQERDIYDQILNQAADPADEETVTAHNSTTAAEVEAHSTVDENPCEVFDDNIELF